MKSLLTTSVAAIMASALWVGAANAAAIISDGNIMLGVNDAGHLNVAGGPASPTQGTTTVGLRYIPTGNEATAHGCLCEGWGVGIGDTGQSGYANIATDGGLNNLTVFSFVSDAVSATSIVDMGANLLRVTHDFAISASADLYKVVVSITNTSGVAITDLRYTRTFDFDVEPSTFSEYMTIGGVATTPSVIKAVDDGFESSNPFDTHDEILAGGTGDFIDLGPADIGANFDFGFGALAAGATFTFEIFYGAALTETAAFIALSTVGAEVYALGQTSCDAAGVGTVCADPATGLSNVSNTFIFAFGEVGGIDVPNVPVPGAALLLLTGLGALGGLKRWRNKAA